MVDMDKMRAKHRDRLNPEVERAIGMLGDISEADGVMGGIKLSDWEAEFIESVTTRLDSGRALSEAQMDSLERMWDRI